MKANPGVALAILTLIFSVFLGGCPGPKFPSVNDRASARQVVLGMTVVFDLTVDSCIYVMRGIAEEDPAKAKAFGKSCYNLVKPVEGLIKVAAEAVDNWDKDKDAIGKVSCAAKAVVAAWPDLKALISEFTAPPKDVDDIVVFIKVVADAVTPVCAPVKAVSP